MRAGDLSKAAPVSGLTEASLRAAVTLPIGTVVACDLQHRVRDFRLLTDYRKHEITSFIAPVRQCCICRFISSAGAVMLSFRFVMIQSDPAITRKTMRMPNASASTLLVLSGPVVMCRKKTR